MSKLFTLTIIPKVIIDKKILSYKKQKDQNRFLKVEASFNDSDISVLVKNYLLENVATTKKELKIDFEQIYVEKDNLVGHIFVLFKIYGYDLQDIDRTKFELIDEQKFKYGKK